MATSDVSPCPAHALRSRHGGRRARLAVAAVAAVLGCVAGPALTSAADPAPSLSEVQARVAALNDQAERITEAYDGAHEQLAAIQRRQKVAADALAAEQAKLSEVRSGIAQQANLAYRTGGLDNQFLSVVTAADPQSFLDQTALLDQVSRFQAGQLVDAAAATRSVQAAQAAYAAQERAAKATLAGIAADKRHIDSLLAQAHALLGRLKAADRARLAAAAAHEASAQRAMRASYTGPASGQAAVAVRFAYAQLGKPYVYGAAGPSSYDCSGLTMAAWAAAGVSLPHNAAMQQSSIRPVSSGDLQPGDLVFFGSPAYHVGIYIGGGNMIAAPHTGDVVKIEPIAYVGNFSGGGRP